MQNKKTNNFRNVLPYYIDFVIPGFEKSYPRGIFKCLSFSNQSSEEWFFKFIDEVENAIGKNFLPIYRMSDGEFEFCIGYLPPTRANNEPLGLYILRKIKRIVNKLFLKIYKKNFTAGGKNYVSAKYLNTELNSLQNLYVKQLKQISQQGFLALHFTNRIKSPSKKQFQQHYIIPIANWLKKQNIILHKKNYYPFYFVYAMLTGPYRYRIYKNRRILVITSYDEIKRKAIIKGLKREGVADVQFIPLSKGRSMYDKVDLSLIKKPVDVVFVGAGIGASNILCQLRSLNTVVIDVGYIIECLADPERKKERTFCWPDKERSEDYRPI